MQVIERFVEQPIFVVVECWIAHGRADDSAFIVREDGIAESVFAVTLLEDTFVGDGLGGGRDSDGSSSESSKMMGS